MKNIKIYLSILISIHFWSCTEENPIGIDQHALDEPDSVPTIPFSNYSNTIDFSTGYYNGKIRSTRTQLEWETSPDVNFLAYKIFRALGGGSGVEDVSEGFESGSFPSGWTEYGDYGGWYITSEDTAMGNYSIRSFSGDYGYEYLEKTITVPQYSDVLISFWGKGINDGDGYFYVNGNNMVGNWGNDYWGPYWNYFSTYYYTGSSTQITLQWEYRTENYGFGLLDNIQISGVEGGSLSYSLIESLNDKNTTSFWDTTLTQNHFYTYKVATIVEQGTHKVDDIAIKTPLWQVPSNIEYEILSPEVVEVIWDDNSESESSFKTYVESFDEYSWEYETINTVSADKDDTSMVISNLSTDTQYRLGVKAYNSWEETDTSYSGSFEINFDPPTYLNTSQVSNTESVYLIWNDNTNLENGFKIQRKIDSDGVYETIGYSGENENYFTDYINPEDFKFDTSFVYQVCAFNTYSDTVFTDYSYYNSYMFTFPPPNNLVANKQSGSKLINLAWSDNSTLEDGFEIERDTGSGFELLTIVNANITSYTDTDTIEFEFDSTYTYRVRTYNNYSGTIYTDYSNEASVTISETTFLFEGFEEGVLPDGWSSWTSGGYGWSISNTAYQGSYSIHCGGGYVDSEYLEVTIDVPQYTYVSISFYTRESDTSGDGDLFINGSYNFDWDNNLSSWSYKTTNHYTSSNNQITLQWRYNTSVYGDVYLDNIQVTW